MLFDMTHPQAAFLIFRIILGLLFLFQGYDKLFRVGMKGVIEAFEEPWANRRMPKVVLVVSAWYTSLSEFFFGACLLLGIFTYPALYFLGLDLILVSAALGMLKPMWDMEHVFPRMILLGALLLLPDGVDPFCLDKLF